MNWNFTKRGWNMEKIQVVLASPSDLGEERKMIKALIDSLNPLYMKYDIYIKGQQLAAYIEQKDNVILAYG